MGSYLFHFDDGSDALIHYGKKGMHWGEWNEETRERYLNEGRPGIVGFLDNKAYERGRDGELIVRPFNGEHLGVRDSDAEARWRHDIQEADYAKATGQNFDINTGKVYENNLLGRAQQGLDNVVENVRTALNDAKITLRNISWDVEFEGKYFVNHTLPDTGKKVLEEVGDFATSHLVDPNKVKRLLGR